MQKPLFTLEPRKEPHSTTSLYVGRLMSADEVALATESRGSAETARIGRRWMFCGDVHPAMFELLRKFSGELPHRVSGFRSTMGGGYGVFTQQLVRHQHRFVLPLYTPAIQRFLKALDAHDHGILLSNDGAEEAVLLPPLPSASHLQELARLGEGVTAEKQRELLVELPLVISVLTAPDAIPGIAGMDDAEQVSVSVLLPDLAL